MGCRLGSRVQAAMIVGWALPGWSGPLLAEVQASTGRWEFSVADTAAKCRIALRSELFASGRHQMTIPLACLRPFPVLGPVESRNLSSVDHLALTVRSGQTVRDFAAGAYIAAGPNGETSRLAAMNGRAEENLPYIELGNKPQSPIRMVEVSTTNVPAEAAGRYSVLREGGKDTGCMLTLHAKGTSQRRGKASLAPGCRDQGIVVFDPAGWEIIEGRLILTARKGHKAHFDAQSDGNWKKDAAEGKTLSLKKL